MSAAVTASFRSSARRPNPPPNGGACTVTAWLQGRVLRDVVLHSVEGLRGSVDFRRQAVHLRDDV